MMTSIRKTFSVLAVFAVIGGFAAHVEALPIVSVVPGDTLVNVGDAFSVDIIVDSQGEALGGFSFTLDFNGALINPTGYANNPGANFGGLFFDFSGGFTPGSLDVFAFGDAAAPGTFVLTNVQFTATAPGVTALDLSNVILSNADGTEAIFPTVNDGRVCIGTVPCPVPEPGLLALLTTGLATAFVRRRARRS